MRGELLDVWPETWSAIWAPLAKHPEIGDELFVDLFRAVVKPPKLEKPIGELSGEELESFKKASSEYEGIVADTSKARTAFREVILPSITLETTAVKFLEDAFRVVQDYENDKFSNSYFLRVEKFLQLFSLRYDLRRPFSLHPTLSGIFASLLKDLKETSKADAHLSGLLIEFEEAMRDLKGDTSPGRIKTCLQKQVNLFEAIGRQSPGVTRNTLGAICNELNVWPHDKVRDAVKCLYDFTSDYPGIRHGGTPANAKREIEMKDLVAVAVLFAGFAPYLSHQFNSNVAFEG